MHKATPGVFRSLRNIAEQKNRPAGFEDGVVLQGSEVTSGAHPGGGSSTAISGNYKDLAEQAKPSKPTGAMTVFSVGKGK